MAVEGGIELKPELTTVLSLHHCPCFVPAPSLFPDRDYMLCCRHAASGGRQHNHRHVIILCKKEALYASRHLAKSKKPSILSKAPTRTCKNLNSEINEASCAIYTRQLDTLAN